MMNSAFNRALSRLILGRAGLDADVSFMTVPVPTFFSYSIELDTGAVEEGIRYGTTNMATIEFLGIATTSDAGERRPEYQERVTEFLERTGVIVTSIIQLSPAPALIYDVD